MVNIQYGMIKKKPINQNKGTDILETDLVY